MSCITKNVSVGIILCCLVVYEPANAATKIGNYNQDSFESIKEVKYVNGKSTKANDSNKEKNAPLYYSNSRVYINYYAINRFVMGCQLSGHYDEDKVAKMRYSINQLYSKLTKGDREQIANDAKEKVLEYSEISKNLFLDIDCNMYKINPNIIPYEFYGDPISTMYSKDIEFVFRCEKEGYFNKDKIGNIIQNIRETYPILDSEEKSYIESFSERRIKNMMVKYPKIFSKMPDRVKPRCNKILSLIGG
ncbi:hypothetical protein BIT28_13070 [Photobacterium proteolyticum]|uniref:Uncharacterized protein n=1 Tax=Photobacterium proteolyticum TaxID=1903952 RepID=A0A1Q9GK53_9GAMM|nr:hypothetical protein [Photobacterium proteolyticum]OLQ74886.1 hypothetical protein BIT28_13070 [Photobacterium proteolyticum]